MELSIVVRRRGRLSIADMGVLQVPLHLGRIRETLVLFTIPRRQRRRERAETPKIIFIGERETEKITGKRIGSGKSRRARIRAPKGRLLSQHVDSGHLFYLVGVVGVDGER
ncbi:hypothetical protein AWENTII_007867 [Aspergillus wentii]